MGIGIIRLGNVVLSPVLSFDGQSLRWWDEEDTITHLSLRGRGTPTGDIRFTFRDSESLTIPPRDLYGRRFLTLDSPIDAGRVDEIAIPPGFRLVAYGTFGKARRRVG